MNVMVPDASILALFITMISIPFCMHWPIIRMLYDKAHISNNNIIAFVVGAIVCFTTAGIGVILKKYCRFFFK